MAYTLGRATAGLLRALSGRPKARVAPAAPAPLPRSAWREARTESLTLRQAVETMNGHTDLLVQIADGWLLSANLKQFDLPQFRANVARSREIATSLEDECAAVVAELRHLEHLRDQAAQFDAQAQRAHRFADRVAQANAALRERLNEVAQARGLDAAALRTEAAKRCGQTEQAEADAFVDGSNDDQRTPLKEWLR
ncbi:MAG: hypothetical protein AAGC76_05365 [Luteibacter sp.]|uniref:hypothetical protein n=1 Tax=Luteibacter sp. TaxID=1886636 RepID=UPI00280772BC|nr:hypothetical protein [Luteibacter sp.]MDQ7995266.1 hypothetical protein [Luteibacter sp.]